MIQLLDYAIEFVAIAFTAHTAIQFASGLVDLWNKSAPSSLAENRVCRDEERLTETYSSSPESSDCLTEVQEPVAQPQLIVVDAIVPFARPVKSATVADLLREQSTRQLKAIARKCRLPRYSKNTQAQLRARLLSEVDAARLREVITAS